MSKRQPFPAPSIRRASLGVACGALLLPAAASAATVKVVSGVVTLQAAAGEVNDITVRTGTYSERPDGLYLDAATPRQLVGSNGCTTIATGVVCGAPDDAKVVAYLGDRDDRFTETRFVEGGESVAYGQDGSDRFVGPTAVIPASVRFDGGAGNDTFSGVLAVGSVTGGAGNDTFDLGEAGDITVSGGDGNDTVQLGENFDYPGTLAHVSLGAGDDSLTLPDTAFDATRSTAYGPFAALSAPVTNLSGGAGRDTVKLPTASSALIFDLTGTKTGLDVVDARATTGRRYLLGTSAPEVFFGSDGDDIINPGSGVDYVGAGAGADRIWTKDDHVDTVNCGLGIDKLTADASDVIQAGSC